MRILVTGAAGFIGWHLAEALAEHAHRVFGADSMVGGRNRPKGVPLLVGDLADAAFARHVAEVTRPEVLVHLAADPREGGSWYRVDSVVRNNTGTLAATLEGCLRVRTLRKVVFFSSMSRYGDAEPPFTEETPAAPVDPYGVCKVACEHIVRQVAAAHGVAWSIIVPHNVIGPGQFVDPTRNVATIFANSALRGEPLRVYGDGRQIRAFSNIRDSLPAYLKVVETDAADMMAVNIGGERPISINDLVEETRKHFPDVAVTHVGSRYGEVRRAWCDHARAQDLLGFHEGIGWWAAVAEIARWVKATGPFEWEPVLVATPAEHTPVHWRKELD